MKARSGPVTSNKIDENGKPSQLGANRTCPVISVIHDRGTGREESRANRERSRGTKWLSFNLPNEWFNKIFRKGQTTTTLSPCILIITNKQNKRERRRKVSCLVFFRRGLIGLYPISNFFLYWLSIKKCRSGKVEVISGRLGARRNAIFQYFFH